MDTQHHRILTVNDFPAVFAMEFWSVPSNWMGTIYQDAQDPIWFLTRVGSETTNLQKWVVAHGGHCLPNYDVSNPLSGIYCLGVLFEENRMRFAQKMWKYIEEHRIVWNPMQVDAFFEQWDEDNYVFIPSDKQLVLDITYSDC